ncbi:helix-turn-helix domain-containing protein [Brevibacillus ruminantium]|uniref:Helix-turn-helix domain-containing protein n=1 Tax=Brevibacillus ruminantium TaxID=2950604 RepID=A0ABY4WQ53_9BACL|nr:helix-turn-helix domain-containing protein [Brevibacillus ruminantium]USG67534.1 helix-turn-helix domain-containing protein [Brevibacillus ruminantium]
MECDAQKLTSALADSTRFSIYQYVSNRIEPVTVQEIAEHFSIHPNVARLHLTKLEDVRLLSSSSDKSGKGGRPSRLYTLSDHVVSLQFPPRDYRLLADIAIESLLSLGEAGEAALINMGHRMGKEMAKRAIKEYPLLKETASLSEKLDHINRLVIAQGLKPDIEALPDGQLRFRVYNCTFSESAKRFPNSVCKMHNALLTGIFETYFGNIELREDESMLSGCRSCNYTVIHLPDACSQLSPES